MPASYLLAGGGTAGHVNPLLALASELSRRDPAASITVLGTREGLEAELVPDAGFPLRFVPRVPIPRRPTPELLRVPVRLRAAIRAAEEAIEESGARVVVGFGGYVAAPAYLAARRRGIPVVVHEANARAGLANRLGARRAAAVAVTFADTRLPRAVLTGLPLRPAVARLVQVLEHLAGRPLPGDPQPRLPGGRSLDALALGGRRAFRLSRLKALRLKVCEAGFERREGFFHQLHDERRNASHHDLYVVQGCGHGVSSRGSRRPSGRS